MWGSLRLAPTIVKLQTRDGRIVGHVPLELSGTQLGYLLNNRCTKTIGRQRTGCSLSLHLPRQDKSPGKADRHISEHKLRVTVNEKRDHSAQNVHSSYKRL